MTDPFARLPSGNLPHTPEACAARREVYRNLIRQGYSRAGIAARMGVSFNSVTKALRGTPEGELKASATDMRVRPEEKFTDDMFARIMCLRRATRAKAHFEVCKSRWPKKLRACA